MVRCSAVLGAGVVSVLLASCGGSGRPPVYPVSGSLKVKGAPATGAFVVFHPRGEQDRRALKPHGRVGLDGTFRLTTFDTNDGAPEGEYAVTVVWPAEAGPHSPDPGETGPDRLGGRFADPVKPVRTVVVHSGDTTIDPIDVN